MSIDKEINKIAIYHNLPSGGGLRVVENITKKYIKKYEVEVIVIGENEPLKIKGVKTIFIKVTPWNGFLLRNLWIVTVLPRIHRLVSRMININYDFVFINHDYFTKSPYLLRYLKVSNTYICHEAQREFYESWNYHTQNFRNVIANILRYPIKIIDEVNVNSAVSIICNSHFSKKTLGSIYKKNCNVVYPGVDTNFFKPNKKPKKPTLLCVGGINPVKDQLFLVRSLCPILNKYELVLVGNGHKEYIDKVKSSCPSSSKIRIISNISDIELRDLYRSSLVTCVSAHNEPFGLSSIESQSSGTPVVSVNEGGLVETIVHKETGYLSQRDENEFLKNVILAIKNNRRLCIAARKNAKINWDWKITMYKMDKLLK